jgi:pimeloyl-ACP methyl ester carboxylesterase
VSSSTEMESQLVRIHGLLIRVCVHRRPGNAVPLLLFNGIGAGMELLQPFIDEMRETTVVCYDIPGAGESETPPYPWRLSKHADLANRLLDHFGFGSVNVLGLSWGGALAQQFARQFPERTEHLVLAATTPGQLMVPARMDSTDLSGAKIRSAPARMPLEPGVNGSDVQMVIRAMLVRQPTAIQ